MIWSVGQFPGDSLMGKPLSQALPLFVLTHWKGLLPTEHLQAVVRDKCWLSEPAGANEKQVRKPKKGNWGMRHPYWVMKTSDIFHGIWKATCTCGAMWRLMKDWVKDSHLWLTMRRKWMLRQSCQPSAVSASTCSQSPSARAGGFAVLGT